MSQPEIFRRCSSCGASFRTSALFCPECGNPTAGAEQTSAAGPDISAKTRAVAAAPHNPSRDSEARVQQARSAARETLEDKARPRAGKILKASGMVLDQAAYDPGIRFLLVVGVLFVLFLVLLFLSKWLG